MRVFFFIFYFMTGLITAASSSNSTINQFDWRLANISVELSAIAYCQEYKGSYFDRPSLKGFSIASSMVGSKGFVGVLPSERSIYVIYSGSTSFLDWVVDADSKLVNYSPCKGCKVHEGFRITEELGFPFMLSTVMELRLFHPTFSIVVAGHSKGAGEATIAAVDLASSGISDIRLINFGSPRVGNSEFVEFLSRKVPQHYRLTHHTDSVPNVPTLRQGYRHMDGEWYEDPELTLRKCTGAEDPTCSAQWAHHFHIDERESSSSGEGSSSEESVPKLRVRRRLGSTGSGGSSGLAPALADEALLGNGYLDVLVELEQSRDDHLHYLGREMRCPVLVSDTRTTAADLLEGATRQEHEQKVGSSKSIGATQEQRQQQRIQDRRVVRMAMYAILFLFALFGLTIFFAVREGARRRTNSNQEQAQTGHHRETELTPLLVVGTSRVELSKTLQPPHDHLISTYSNA